MRREIKQAIGQIIVIAAPSGAGKTSLVDALLKKMPMLSVAISHTTRPKRDGEINGVHYHFVSHSEFEDLKAQNAFVEYAEVFQYQYGTSKMALETAMAKSEGVILEIDWQGAHAIRTLFPQQTVSIFIVPPSLACLKQRLTQRAQDQLEVITRRLAAAREEIAHYAEFDYLVVNDRFEQALGELSAIIVAERLKTPLQRQRHADLLASLI